VTDALSFLLDSQVNSQGWGYGVNHAPVVEATAVVALYLRRFSAADAALQRALQWLEAIQHEDGGWGLNALDAESGWHTAWALLALKRCAGASPAIAAGSRWLLQVEVMRFQDAELLADGRRVAGIDFALGGWSWLPGEASWVEPTAIAMLALQDSPLGEAAQPRLEEAVRYLVDRRCPGGGWNVGNPMMFDALLPARAAPTAWSLMALHALAPEVILAEDIQTLRGEMAQDGGLLALSWGLLALRLLGEDSPEAESQLLAAQSENGSWQDNPYLTAIAALALRGEF